MEIRINSIRVENIDVTTRDFPGISEGLRDLLPTWFVIDFTIRTSISDLNGIAKLKYDASLRVVDIEKIMSDKIKDELKQL